MKDNTPPNSRDAEEALVGSVLIAPELFEELSEIVGPEDFFIKRNAWIWEALSALDNRGEPFDIITVANQLDRAGRLEDIGGMAYLTALLNRVPTTLNAETYAKIVRDMSVRRSLLTAANRTAQLAYDEGIPADDAVDMAALAIEKLAALRPAPANDLLDGLAIIEGIKNGQVVERIPFGLSNIDNRLLDGGPTYGNLVIVAGRPGTGKSAFMVSTTCNAVHPNKMPVPTSLFSCEMSGVEVVARMLANITGTDSRVILKQGMSSGFFDNRALSIMARSNISTRDIYRAAKANKSKLVLVDYLQLLKPGSGDTREQQVAGLSRDLKNIAGELNAVIVAACQINRAVEQRADRRPQLSDLRESGAIEQDADIVIFLHEPPNSTENQGGTPLEAIVAKHRNGPTGLERLLYYKATSRFVPAVLTMRSVQND